MMSNPDTSVVRLIVTALLIVQVASCTDEARPDAAGSVTRSSATMNDGAPFRRACDSRIYVEDHDADFNSSPDAVGPVKFLRISEEGPHLDPEVLTPNEDGKLEGVKYVTVVNGEVDGAVRLSISKTSRPYARLTYDPATSGPALLGAGDLAVEFEACEGGDTQYNGGFRVNGPRCVEVTVELVKSPQNRWRGSLPFGTKCSAPLSREGG